MSYLQQLNLHTALFLTAVFCGVTTTFSKGLDITKPLNLETPGYSITFPPYTQMDTLEGEEVILPLSGAAGIAKIWFKDTISGTSEEFIDSMMNVFESLIGGTITVGAKRELKLGKYMVTEAQMEIKNANVLNQRVRQQLNDSTITIEKGRLYFIETNTGIFLLQKIQILPSITAYSIMESALETLDIKSFPGVVSVERLAAKRFKKSNKKALNPKGERLFSITGSMVNSAASGIFFHQERD